MRGATGAGGHRWEGHRWEDHRCGGHRCEDRVGVVVSGTASSPRPQRLSTPLFAQDGTRAYYFTTEELSALFDAAGFDAVRCEYRRPSIKYKV